MAVELLIVKPSLPPTPSSGATGIAALLGGDFQRHFDEITAPVAILQVEEVVAVPAVAALCGP